MDRIGIWTEQALLNEISRVEDYYEGVKVKLLNKVLELASDSIKKDIEISETLARMEAKIEEYRGRISELEGRDMIVELKSDNPISVCKAPNSEAIKLLGLVREKQLVKIPRYTKEADNSMSKILVRASLYIHNIQEVNASKSDKIKDLNLLLDRLRSRQLNK